MAVLARTILKKVELESYIQKELLDKSFNRSGICAYCTRKANCCLSSSNGLVFDCDDYEAGEETGTVLTFTTLDVSNDDEPIGYGLCTRCQNRDLCQLKRINGGIWHCDEYL